MNQKYNYEDLEYFLTTLTKYDIKEHESPMLCWQGFLEGSEIDTATSYKFFPLTDLAKQFDMLCRANARKFCISFAINELSCSLTEKGIYDGYRRKDSVIKARAHMVDIDKLIKLTTIDALNELLKPNMIVLSSAVSRDGETFAKAHLYFAYGPLETAFNETVLRNYNMLQRAIALRVDDIINELEGTQKVEYTDKSITIEKAIRVPGFYHQKYSDNIYNVNIYRKNDSTLITQDTFNTFFDEIGVDGDYFHEAKKATSERVFDFKTDDNSISRYSGVELGNRHSAMVQYATDLFFIHRFWYDAALGACLIANGNNKPPLDTLEVEEIVKSAYNFWKEKLTKKAFKQVKDGDSCAIINMFWQRADEIAHKAREGEEGIDHEEQVILKRIAYDYTDRAKYIDVLSDKSIMYRLYERYKDRILGSMVVPTKFYNEKSGMFEDDGGEVDEMINEIIIDMPYEDVVRDQFMKVSKSSKGEDGEVVQYFDKDKFKTYIKDLRSCSKNKGFANMIPTMKVFSVKPEDFDANPNLINCPNGVIDLTTAKLLPHSHTFKMTKCLRYPYKDGGYRKFMEMDTDEEWKDEANGGEGNLWTNFIWEITDNDLELCRFMQIMFGYALNGDLDAQVLFFFYGLGENGKSKCLETILHTMGTYGKTVTNQMYVDSAMSNKSDLAYLSELAQLPGTRMVLPGEIEKDQCLKESSIKDITTGTEIIAKHYHKATFTFKPQFTSFLHGNYHPIVKGEDHGIWRRIVTLPFNVDFSQKRDPSLGDKLKDPSLGVDILNWMMAGNMIYNKHGLTIPSTCQEAKLLYKDTMHPTLKFIRDVIRPQINDDKISPLEIYEVYKIWCNDNNVEYSSSIKLGKELAKNGFKQLRESSKRYYPISIEPYYKNLLTNKDVSKDSTRNKIIEITRKRDLGIAQA